MKHITSGGTPMNISIIDKDIIFKGMAKREGRWSEIAEKLNEIKQQAKAIALIESELIEELKELSEGKASYDENGFTYKPYDVKGQVGYTRIPQLHNVDLEPFRKASYIAWKFGIVK
jgi:hypothetical protein